MTTGYNYTTYVAALQTMIVSQNPDVSFDTILPSIINDAEQRIYRELNLISTVSTDTSTSTTGSNRAISLANTFITITNLNVLTPAGSGSDTGTRVPLTPVSRDVLDTLWPSNTSNTGTPAMFCMVTQWTALLGPPPDGVYTIEAVGTSRPAPLSASNTTTFLSQYLPDLFMAASMVFASGYQRNFAVMANDPQSGMSWEQHYQLLKASANEEELRKRFAGASWTSQPVSPAAQPQRG